MYSVTIEVNGVKGIHGLSVFFLQHPMIPQSFQNEKVNPRFYQDNLNSTTTK